MNIKTIAKIIIVLGAILGLMGSLSYFFAEKFIYDYNQSIPQSEEMVIGAFIFLISLASLLLALLAFKHSYANSKFLFIIVIILGVSLFTLLSFTAVISSLISPFTAALLILAGGIIGDIGVAIDQ
jgi:CHASE2 domain-containing sensor protein